MILFEKLLFSQSAKSKKADKEKLKKEEEERKAREEGLFVCFVLFCFFHLEYLVKQCANYF